MKHSRLDIAKHKGKVLDLIMSWKRDEVAAAMESMPLEQVRAFASVAPPAIDIAAALTARPGASLIAEVKRASPSRGLIAKDWNPELIAETYATSGAAAISCLTDARYFQGKLEYLTSIKQQLRDAGLAVPVLRKDFIFHEYQVYEARMAGADGLLLIVAVLSNAQIAQLLDLTRRLNMEALVECHDEADVSRALEVDATMIGVNNRDLRTFEVDIENTARLRAQIPRDKIVVGESGIRDATDVAALRDMGCDGILVGETFCKLPQAERGPKVREFVEAGLPVDGQAVTKRL